MGQTPKQGRNYYEILGVVRTATPKDIEGAFRNLARQWHPDVCRDIHQAAENFKLIAEAYEVLGDPEKRRRYDRAQARSRRRRTPSGARRSATIFITASWATCRVRFLALPPPGFFFDTTKKDRRTHGDRGSLRP